MAFRTQLLPTGVCFSSQSSYHCYAISWISSKNYSLFFTHKKTARLERQNSTVKAYLQAFISFKQNYWTWLLPIAKFAYNNTKNTSNGYMLFKFNYGYHSRVSYEKDLNSCSKSKSMEELFFELQKLITVCQQNFYHTQKFQKQAQNKDIKPQSYTPGNKV